MTDGLSTGTFRTNPARSFDRHNGPYHPTARWSQGVQTTRPEARVAKPAWLESILQENGNGDIYLTEQLASEVFRHVAMNLDPLSADAVPQILCVTGPFGCGKTTGVEETLRRIGCQAARIQASELESPHAGVPPKLIHDRYVEASAGQSDTDKPHVLVIEDIHLALGVTSTTTTTIHLQMVVAELLSICDHPHRRRGELTVRIPIVATANDLSKVHGALIRPGRTRVVAMELSDVERTYIATHILREFLTREQVASLTAAQPDWPIAAFRQLKALLLRRGFDRRHSGKSAGQVLTDLISSPVPKRATPGHDWSISPSELAQAVAAVNAEAHAKGDFADS